MQHFIDIHQPMYSSHTYEVVAFPEDDSFPPITITHLPVSAEEGDMEIVIPEEEQFDGEIFIFEFTCGRWQESGADEDVDLSFGLTA